jgi:hypothetical protein
MNRTLVSWIQGAALVIVCALIGFALSRSPGAEAVPAWVPTGIGALIGFASIGLLMLFDTNSAAVERKLSPRAKFALKLCFYGLAIAATGFLVATLAMPTMGYAIMLVGWCIGAGGIGICLSLAFGWNKH